MTSPGAPSRSRKPREDAQRNSQRLVEEAELLFNERGISAPLDEVARRAGVSSGTLYRHFPTRLDLMRALAVRIRQRADTVIADTARLSTASEAVDHFVHASAEVMIDYPATREILQVVADADPNYAPGDHYQARMLDLVARAKAEGALHPDVGASDLIMTAIMVSSLGSYTGVRESGLWRRYAGLALRGLGRDGELSHVAAPVSSGDEYRELLRT